MTSHTDPADALRGASRSIAAWPIMGTKVAGNHSNRCVSGIAVRAAMLGQSLRNLEHQNFGFETQSRFIAWINPMLGNYKPDQLEPTFR